MQLPKSEMRPLRETSELSLPAVPAKFEAVPTKILETSSLSIAATPLDRKSDNFDISMYKETQAECSRVQSAPSGTRKEFSERLTTKSSKTVINFAECKIKGDWERCELTKDTNGPSPKRRKRKIMPVELYSSTSGPSTSNHSTGNSSTSLGTKKSESGDKKEMGKTYLKEVKRTLSQDKYKEFAAMIQNYTKNGDVDELLRCLGVLFPASENLQHLFVGEFSKNFKILQKTAQKNIEHFFKVSITFYKETKMSNSSFLKNRIAR